MQFFAGYGLAGLGGCPIFVVGAVFVTTYFGLRQLVEVIGCTVIQ
jgi:hypothetical protein